MTRFSSFILLKSLSAVINGILSSMADAAMIASAVFNLYFLLSDIAVTFIE
jgi:hypothetical protein